MPTPRGLFLDGGSECGWAVMAYKPGFELIAKGTFRTASAGVGIWGYRLVSIDRNVQQLVDKFHPSHIGFEAPWMPRGDSESGNPMSARFLICVAGKFEEVAARNDLECSEVATATARKMLTGKGRFTDDDGRPLSTEESKQRMIAHCVARGWLVADGHQADAIAVGMVCVDNYLRGR